MLYKFNKNNFLLFCKLIGWVLTYLIILLPFLSEGDTCTQGVPEGFITSIYICAYIFIAFNILVIPTLKIKSNIWKLDLFHIITILVYLYKLPNYIYYTTILGDHICDGFQLRNDFIIESVDSYGESDIIQRVYAPILILLLIYFLVIMILDKRNQKKMQ